MTPRAEAIYRGLLEMVSELPGGRLSLPLCFVDGHITRGYHTGEQTVLLMDAAYFRARTPTPSTHPEALAALAEYFDEQLTAWQPDVNFVRLPSDSSHKAYKK